MNEELAAALGRYGDTRLAHVTPEEEALLESLGGAGTTNPHTGLPEYYYGDGGASGDFSSDDTSDFSDGGWAGVGGYDFADMFTGPGAQNSLGVNTAGTLTGGLAPGAWQYDAGGNPLGDPGGSSPTLGDLGLGPGFKKDSGNGFGEKLGSFFGFKPGMTVNPDGTLSNSHTQFDFFDAPAIGILAGAVSPALGGIYAAAKGLSNNDPVGAVIGGLSGLSPAGSMASSLFGGLNAGNSLSTAMGGPSIDDALGTHGTIGSPAESAMAAAPGPTESAMAAPSSQTPVGDAGPTESIDFGGYGPAQPTYTAPEEQEAQVALAAALMGSGGQPGYTRAGQGIIY